MSEPRELTLARDHLARAERSYRTEDGLFHLEEGLGLLDELVAGDDAHQQMVARNLAATYAAKLFKSVADLLDADRAVPEPALEHLFKVLLAFDQGDFDLPAESREVKIRIARRLIDRYYEGHSPEVKQKALQQLQQIGETSDAQRERPRGARTPGKKASRRPGR